MGGKTAIAMGLGAGVLAGVAGLALVAALLPPPDAPSPVVSAAPSGGPSPSASAPASADASPSASAGDANFHVGEPAPSLRVPQLGGGEIDLANLRGTPVWLNFMATWCPSCQDEFPLMNSFYVRYADEGLVVIAVDVREDVSTVDAFAKSLNVQFAMGLDEDGSAQETWQALALPTHFWIDADGIVRYGALGAIGPDIMEEALEIIMPGVDVEP